MKPIKVFLADDHEAFLVRIANFLKPRFEVLAAFASGCALLDEVRRLTPDVVVLDITMPDMNGFEVAKMLRRMTQRMGIVFLTVHDDPDYVREAMDSGGDGYVVKSRMAIDLPEAIKAAVAHRRFVSPSEALLGTEHCSDQSLPSAPEPSAENDVA